MTTKATKDTLFFFVQRTFVEFQSKFSMDPGFLDIHGLDMELDAFGTGGPMADVDIKPAFPRFLCPKLRALLLAAKRIGQPVHCPMNCGQMIANKEDLLRRKGGHLVACVSTAAQYELVKEENARRTPPSPKSSRSRTEKRDVPGAAAPQRKRPKKAIDTNSNGKGQPQPKGKVQAKNFQVVPGGIVSTTTITQTGLKVEGAEAHALPLPHSRFRALAVAYDDPEYTGHCVPSIPAVIEQLSGLLLRDSVGKVDYKSVSSPQKGGALVLNPRSGKTGLTQLDRCSKQKVVKILEDHAKSGGRGAVFMQIYVDRPPSWLWEMCMRDAGPPMFRADGSEYPGVKRAVVYTISMGKDAVVTLAHRDDHDQVRGSLDVINITTGLEMTWLEVMRPEMA